MVYIGYVYPDGYSVGSHLKDLTFFHPVERFPLHVGRLLEVS